MVDLLRARLQSMRKSLRWRLQAWYALVLLAVVAGFAGMLYVETRAARFQEIDARLESSAQYLDALLRRFPPHELSGTGVPPGRPEFPPPPGRPPRDRSPDDPDGPPEGPNDARPRPRPPPPQHRERLMDELDLPAGPPRANGGEYFAIWRGDGSIIKARALPTTNPPPAPDTPGPAPKPRVYQRGAYREVAVRGPALTTILVGQSVAREHAALSEFAWRLTGAAVVVLVIGLAGGWIVSARILQPIAAIADTASSISAANLSGRIDTESVDRELAELAGMLNATFDRLQAAFEQQARFTADASHELRTPLAVIRGHAELALSRPREAHEYQDALNSVLHAAERMTGLVDGLLTLARADAGKLELRREVVDLRSLVEENMALLQPMADERRIQVRAELTDVRVSGDPLRLGQVITNLVSNAVNYNREGGKIAIRLEIAAKEARLTVADTGYGIPEADRPHLFERFYRVDKSRVRARSAGGNGLGLAICKSIIDAHGGSIGFDSDTDRGTTFWIQMPVLARDPTHAIFLRRK